MRKNFKFKILLCTLVMMIAIFGSALNVFAASQGDNDEIKEYIANSETIAGSVKTYFDVVDNPDSEKYNDSKYKVYERVEDDKTYYYYIEEVDEPKAEKAIKRVLDNKEAVENIQGITDGLNIEADTDKATGILSGFTGIISMVLGLMVILISVGMTIFSAFDLCYIAFPVFRNKCEEAKQTGQGIMASNKVNKNTGETKLRFVSDDAQYAVVAADTVQSGKNPFVIYFGKRLLSYIILAILLFILLTGNITVFTSLALKVVSGIIELINNF